MSNWPTARLFVRRLVGYAISTWTGSWVLSFVVAFVAVALVGSSCNCWYFAHEGQDLRQTMVTIGLSIVFADLMLWAFERFLSGPDAELAGWADPAAARHPQ